MPLRLKIISSIRDVRADDWNLCAGSHPFVQHSFLNALEASGSIGKQRGVQPCYATLYDQQDVMVACAPGMLKWGAIREYGPEIQWLKKGLEAGCFSWPKFQLGISLFPFAGPRILMHPHHKVTNISQNLIHALMKVGMQLGAKQSFNVMHVDETTARSLQQTGALLSYEPHSMWLNHDYADMRDYLARIPERKRCRFLKERRDAEGYGLRFKYIRGSQITGQMLDDYYEGHRRVCARYGHQPWLSSDAYHQIASAMGDQAYLLGYFDVNSAFVAGCLGVHAPEESQFYLLQWSEMKKFKGVALDLICARPIEFAIENRISKINSGLAASHKVLRGWQTQRVFNAHWFADPRLKALAVEFMTRRNEF